MEKTTFQDIINIQKEFDTNHGFIIDKSSDVKKYMQMSKDLIGLFGEIGEFSNTIKKINLILDYKTNASENDLTCNESNLREELVDIFIYLVRLAEALDLNLEEEFISKLNKNKIKYAEYEQ